MSADIVVTGKRLGNSVSIDPVYVLDISFLMQAVKDDNSWSGSLPGLVRDVLNVDGEITVNGFDDHHKNLVKLAIAKLAEIPEFKAAFEQQKSGSVNVHFEKKDNLTDAGGSDRTNPFDIIVYAPQYNHGGYVNDALFVQTIMHEMIHTFNNPQWDYRLHHSDWDKDLFFRTGVNQLIGPDGQIQVSGISDGTRSVVVGDLYGGTVSGGSFPSVLVGTSFGNSFSLGSAGDLVLGGTGSDTYYLSVGAGVDTIIDEGGVDTLVLGQGVAPSSVSLLSSSSGDNLSLYVDGVLEAQISANASSPAIESLRIGNATFSLSAFITGLNGAPTGHDESSDMYGAVNAGMVGRASGDDPNGDKLVYSLKGVTGDFSELGWFVNDEGYIFTNFNRAAATGDQYTYLQLEVTDGVSSSTFDYTIHWGEEATNWLMAATPEVNTWMLF